MAYYKHSRFLASNNNQAFDNTSSPGATTPYSGVYRCEGCGHEIASNQGNPLPPQNHHQHNYAQGSIRWRLIVATQ
jgi:hypothetical protein